MPSAEPLVVFAGRLVDVVAGEVLRDRALVLDGDRIGDVVPAAEAPTGARTIDLSRRTVLPGLIDSHAHLIGELDEGQGYAYLVNRSSAQEALTGVTNALATLLGGVTTVRDVGTFHAFVDLALREAIEDGRIPGPRMMCAGAYVTCPGGGGDITGLAPEVPVPSELRVGVSTGPDEVRANVRRIFEAGADFIKVLATGAVLTSGTDPGKPELTEEEIRAAVEEAGPTNARCRPAHGAKARTRHPRRRSRDRARRLIDDETIASCRARPYLVAACTTRMDDPGGPRLGNRRGASQDRDDQRRSA